MHGPFVGIRQTFSSRRCSSRTTLPFRFAAVSPGTPPTVAGNPTARCGSVPGSSTDANDTHRRRAPATRTLSGPNCESVDGRRSPSVISHTPEGL